MGKGSGKVALVVAASRLLRRETMSDRENTVIPTKMCVVQDQSGRLHFRLEKDVPFGSVLHDDGERVIHEIPLDFANQDPIIANAFRVVCEMDTLDSNREGPMEQLLEFIVYLGYHAALFVVARSAIESAQKAQK